MRTPVLYLDTSVLGGYFDEEWMQPTRELWRQMEDGLWRFVTSLLTADELVPAPSNVRDLFDTTFDPAGVLDLTDDMDRLASAYVAHGVVSTRTMHGTWRPPHWPVPIFSSVGISGTWSMCSVKPPLTASTC